jgi:histidyl-tRNA synthetase
MFSGKTQVPCVGISFGIDRIFSITQAAQKKKERKNEVDVFVMAFGGKDFNGLLKERSQVCARLWDAGIKVGCSPAPRVQPTLRLEKAEFLYKVKPKLQNQFKAAEAGGVPFALILGEVCRPLLAAVRRVALLTFASRTNLPKARRKSRRWAFQRTTR